MWHKMQTWLIPQPLENEESQRVATLLTFIMMAFLVGVPVYGVVILVDDPALVLSRAVMLGIFVVFLAGMVWLLRRGYVLTVGRLLTAQMWLGLTGFVFIDSGINSPAFHWYTVIIIVAGLVMGIPGLRLATIMSVAISLIIVLLNLAGMFDVREYSPVYIWSLDASAFVFTAILLGLAVSGLNRSLRRARQAEATWRTLVEENPDLIYKIDRVVFTSGDTPDEQVQVVLDQIPMGYHERFNDVLRAVFDTGTTQDFECTADERVYSVRVNPITVGDVVEAAIVTLRDITENRLADEQRLQLAVETEKLNLLQSLVADVTHDMKTPLTTIETSLYLLERANPTIEPRRLDQIRSQTQSLNVMVQNLLTIMRLDSSPGLQRARVDLAVLCEQVHDEFAQVAAQKSIVLAVETPDEAIVIEVDQGELKRVLVNLVENALNYTREGGTVTVRVLRHTDVVVIEVADTGIGLSEQDAAKVFDRFFRTMEAKKRVTSGSGLGLAIVKRIVEMHGGMIAVESVEGEGTVFRVMLPQTSKASLSKN